MPSGPGTTLYVRWRDGLAQRWQRSVHGHSGPVQLPTGTQQRISDYMPRFCRRERPRAGGRSRTRNRSSTSDTMELPKAAASAAGTSQSPPECDCFRVGPTSAPITGNLNAIASNITWPLT